MRFGVGKERNCEGQLSTHKQGKPVTLRFEGETLYVETDHLGSIAIVKRNRPAVVQEPAFSRKDESN